jgi:hypothetical protein
MSGPFKAFQGYKCDGNGGFLVKVCSWCPDAAEATVWAAPLRVTHTLCPECYRKEIGNLLGEQDLSCESQNNPIQPNHA